MGGNVEERVVGTKVGEEEGVDMGGMSVGGKQMRGDY